TSRRTATARPWRPQWLPRPAADPAFRRPQGMTRSLGGALTPPLVERFSQRDLARRLGIALPFVTLDPDGRPHPMLLSYLELRAYDSGTVGLVIGARTRSASNLVERGTGTLLAIEPDATLYVKLKTVDGPLPVSGSDEYGLGYFLLAVDEVLEDAPADWEGGMRIPSAVRSSPAPTLDEPWRAPRWPRSQSPARAPDYWGPSGSR